VQGGSTLTQQTAKALLISSEGFVKATKRSGAAGLKRKAREAILALRLEKALRKEEILYLYLNGVYLGHHSYGVQAAAENYFRKDVRDLTLAEAALIAGLPQAPSKYSPFLNPRSAKARRGYVLGQMKDKGMISRAEYDAAMTEEIHVYPVEDVFHEFAPYFVEQGAQGHRPALRQPRLVARRAQALHHHGLGEAARRPGRDARRASPGGQAAGVPRPGDDPRGPRSSGRHSSTGARRRSRASRSRTTGTTWPW
jgi:membrane peptidoglycan carboxypeptidase